jgi:hypothetical protein
MQKDLKNTLPLFLEADRTEKSSKNRQGVYQVLRGLFATPVKCS